ncbi:MAG: fasciclin domain-containing protein [Chitinophagaceae bacterium]|nr:fasciclin domain-containing protein [Chitinophagaceae bacterium]
MNAAFAASGIPSEGALAFFSAGLLDTVLKCHLVSQVVPASAIPQTFPNLPYPTFFNPAPTLTALARLNVFPSTRNGAWLNNIPLKQTDIPAYNGMIHKVAAVVMPPSRVLWNRINTDTVSTNPNALAYLRAAIIRADSGYAPNAAPSLIYFLNNPLANFTVFAPTDAAFRATLTGAIAQALIAQGMPPADALATAAALASTPAVFSNPALYGVLTAQTVRGIVAYHVLGNRAFSNNLPTTATAYPTLLNGVVPTHPGITLQATFGAPPFVTAATVKGLANATASNVLITLPPVMEPGGSSDQHYVNGVLHKIDQVLLPQ